jgi:protein tyrosine phosphatase
MIYERNVAAVIMLSQLHEDGQEVCYQYWPSDNEIYGEFTVELKSENPISDGCVERTFLLKLDESNKHTVVQYHITDWGSSGHVTNPAIILEVIDNMERVQRQTGNSPIVVHCSDSVSRSGMFCALLTTINKCKTEGVIDVFQVLKAQRIQKPGSVQTTVSIQEVN